jgi:hypothetical protein
MTGFAPSAARGRSLDAAVRRRLAQSLRALAESARGLVACDAAAVQALADAVQAHPVRPAVMAHYAEAMLAIGAGDAEGADAALAALADPALRRPALPRLVTLDEAELGAGVPALYRRLLNDDPESPVGAVALDAAARQAAPARIAAARGLLGPDFAGEIDAVAHEIVAVAPVPGAAFTFHGATTFYLWGAIALNLPAHPTDADLAVGLAHESGHAVLFAQTFGVPMTLNPDAERHASPLRTTPRPMEGIVHATWVLARMQLAVETMLQRGRLDAAARAAMLALRAELDRDYADGLAVVEAHARFTPEGAAAFAPARAWMASRMVQAAG